MSLTGAGLNSMRSVPTFGTIGAISEIVDNSIQWKTQNDVEITIVFIQRDKVLDEILIADNGQGMNLDSKGKEIIDYCLYFGGGTNHGAKKGLGRYGIGLPYACCSQATEYHVYSWTDKNKIKHVFRNHKDFGEDDQIIDTPHTIDSVFPKYFDNYLPNLPNYKSGTIIQWKNCDRLTYKKINTIITHLENKLGRIYRYYIGKGVDIKFRAYNKPKGNYPSIIEDYCRSIKKFDPLFLDTGTIAEKFNNGIPTSDIFCPDKKINFIDNNGESHNFIIRASLVKEDIQYPNLNVNNKGGNTEIGKLYKEVQGISLVRAKRELRIHDFGFNYSNGNSDPKHRWWKVEIQFEPASDELLGVNANKTDALNFRYIDDEQEDQNVDYIKLRYKLAGEVHNLLLEINKEMEKRKDELKKRKNTKKQKCPNCKEISLVNGQCEKCGEIVKYCQVKGHENIILSNGRCPSCDNVNPEPLCSKHNVQFDDNGICPKCEATSPLSKDEIDELMYNLNMYQEFNGDKESIRSLIEWFTKSGKKQFIVFISNTLDPSNFFNISPVPGKFDIILVNKSHPFYINHIGPLREIAEADVTVESKYNYTQALESIILFIISWVQTERTSTSDQKMVQRFRTRFGNNLNELLDVWTSD